MRRTYAFVIAVLLAMNIFAGSANAQKSEIFQNYGNIPLAFTENSGQIDPCVKFTTKGIGATMFFTQEGTTFLLSRETEESRSLRAELKHSNENMPAVSAMSIDNEPEREYEYFVLKLHFIGANDDPEVIGDDRLPWNNNYFTGSDPSKWRTDIANNSRVRLKNIYEGIDLVYYGNNNSIKYDFVVQPGADPEQILLAYDFGKFDDNELLKINNECELEVKTPLGNLIERKPFSYQVINGKKVAVDTYYKIVNKESNNFTFSVDTYNPKYPLIIDPELTYSTFLGGSDSEYGYSIAVDASGNAYITGNTYSTNFPKTSGAYDETHNGNNDVFITKLNSSGSDLVYSTFLGGSSYDYGCSIAIDASGNAYVTGYTNSSNFPKTTGAYDESHNGGYDVFVTKLNPSGNDLVYSTFIGGGGDFSSDYGYGIAIDGSGNAYITGYTESSNFPTTEGAFDSTGPKPYDYDAFVSKLNSSGSNLVYSTFLGGSYYDHGNGIAVDASGNAYITGITSSSGFPTTPAAYDTSFNEGGSDVFITKLNSSGSALVYSTFIGGSIGGGEGPGDEVSSIALDAGGNAYIIGATESGDFPTTPGAFDESHNGGRLVFVTKLNSLGSDLIYSTFISGTGEYSWDEGNSIAVDAVGNAYITGSTDASNFPTTENAYDNTLGGYSDAFVSKLSSSGSSLIYSTFLGGVSSDVGNGIAIDANSNAFITGYTYSGDFPTTPGVYDSTYYSSADVFITKFNINSPPVIAVLTDASINEGVLFTRQVNASDLDFDPLTYSLTEAPEGMTIGSSSGLISWTTGYDDAGNYTVTVKVEDVFGGEDTESFTLTVNNVNRAPVISALSDTTTYEGVLFTRQVYAHDPEGSPITYSLTGQPGGMTIGSSSGVITWTPGYDQAGIYNFGVKASDVLGAKDTERFTLTVLHVNVAPVIIAYSPALDSVITEGDTVEFSVTVQDIDVDTLAYTWYYDGTMVAADTTTDSVSAAVVVFPFGSLGAHAVKVSVTDGEFFADTTWNIITAVIVSWHMDFPAGWSMASLGLEFPDKSLNSVFPDALSAYEFDNGYYRVTGLSRGKGYWINLSETYAATVEHNSIEELVFNLTTGWHMIGSISYPLAVGNIVQEPPNSIVSIYRFAGRYSLVTDFLSQGEGYWIKVANNAALTFSSGNMLKAPVITYVNEHNKDAEFTLPVTFQTGNHSKVLKIYFKEKADEAELAALNSVFELPPLPPAGILDVRFGQENTNGLEALYIAEDAATERDILLTIPYNEQLVVRWDKSLLEPGRFVLKDGLGGVLFYDIDMSATGELIVTSPGPKVLKFSYLGKDGGIITDYELSPNYPNPFNPSTKIEYMVKSPGSVKLSVYNVLGQKIKVLVDEYKQSGRYSVEWDGTDQSGKSVAGGLYIYRLQVNDYTATKKMVYIKLLKPT